MFVFMSKDNWSEIFYSSTLCIVLILNSEVRGPTMMLLLLMVSMSIWLILVGFLTGWKHNKVKKRTLSRNKNQKVKHLRRQSPPCFLVLRCQHW